MIGHEALIRMRLAGKRPAFIAMECGQDALEARWARFWHQSKGVVAATVHVMPSEPLATLDFRFCVGMPVVLTGDDERRTRAISAALMAAGARRVSGYVTRPVMEYGELRQQFLAEWHEFKEQGQ